MGEHGKRREEDRQTVLEWKCNSILLLLLLHSPAHTPALEHSHIYERNWYISISMKEAEYALCAYGRNVAQKSSYKL